MVDVRRRRRRGDGRCGVRSGPGADVDLAAGLVRGRDRGGLVVRCRCARRARRRPSTESRRGRTSRGRTVRHLRAAARARPHRARRAVRSERGGAHLGLPRPAGGVGGMVALGRSGHRVRESGGPALAILDGGLGLGVDALLCRSAAAAAHPRGFVGRVGDHDRVRRGPDRGGTRAVSPAVRSLQAQPAPFCVGGVVRLGAACRHGAGLAREPRVQCGLVAGACHRHRRRVRRLLGCVPQPPAPGVDRRCARTGRRARSARGVGGGVGAGGAPVRRGARREGSDHT